MDTTPDAATALRAFLRTGTFAARGAVITDLDGTAVIEREGRVHLPPEVEGGLAHIRALGRPVIANTLRFPLSVIGVFGDDWQRATGTALPLVTLKGSQIGVVTRSASGEPAFDEWAATPLLAAEIDEVMRGIDGLVANGIDDLLLFSYRRDWTHGERIWTPDAGRIDAVRDRYRSASGVWSSGVRALHDELLSHAQCMIFLLIAAAEDKLMAYQHTQRSNFFTHRGVSKRTGARAIAAHMGIDLAASIGCGDAPPDDFLAEVGFAIVVGDNGVEYRGLTDTVRVPGVAALGTLLAVIGERIA